MFFRKKEKFVAIKLYSIGSEQKKISRPDLVSALLSLFECEFSMLPKEYVISGPYGVRKGSSIGVKAFKNKLSSKGHEQYYGLTGDTEGKFGFKLILDCNLDPITYSELIIWYNASAFNVSFHEVVKKLSDPFSISCGYEIDIIEGIDIFTENKIKKSWFGEISVKVSYEHLNWIKRFEYGDVRDVFESNLLTEKQLKKALSIEADLSYTKYGKLYFVERNS